jgi:hypothetical protein
VLVDAQHDGLHQIAIRLHQFAVVAQRQHVFTEGAAVTLGFARMPSPPSRSNQSLVWIGRSKVSAAGTRLSGDS